MTTLDRRGVLKRFVLGMFFVALVSWGCDFKGSESDTSEFSTSNFPTGGTSPGEEGPVDMVELPNCDEAGVRVEGPGAEVVEFIGADGCVQTAVLSDGSAQASVDRVDTNGTAAGSAICSFNSSDANQRNCVIDASFDVFHSNFSPEGGEHISLDFSVYVLGPESVPFEAEATAQCGAETQVLTDGERKLILAGSGFGMCTVSIQLNASSTDLGENAAVAVLQVAAAQRLCFGNEACARLDPAKPCCGVENCHDCSLGNSCFHDTQCADGLSCRQFSCVAGEVGDSCDTDFNCSGSLICDDGSSSCAEPADCDPVENAGCAVDERCCGVGRVGFGEPLNAVCCPEGDAALGEACVLDGVGEDNCMGGSVCVDGFCRQICVEIPDSCPPGELCDAATYVIDNIPGNNAGACVPEP